MANSGWSWSVVTTPAQSVGLWWCLGTAAGTAQERGSEQGLDKFVNQKIYDKNGLLTDLVVVQKETEVGQISRAVMGHDSGKLNIGFGERRN